LEFIRITLVQEFAYWDGSGFFFNQQQHWDFLQCEGMDFLIGVGVLEV
jgi:hypothetical protein